MESCQLPGYTKFSLPGKIIDSSCSSSESEIVISMATLEDWSLPTLKWKKHVREKKFKNHILKQEKFV